MVYDYGLFVMNKVYALILPAIAHYTTIMQKRFWHVHSKMVKRWVKLFFPILETFFKTSALYKLFTQAQALVFSQCRHHYIATKRLGARGTMLTAKQRFHHLLLSILNNAVTKSMFCLLLGWKKCSETEKKLF